jgi:hypothetical protein
MSSFSMMTPHPSLAELTRMAHGLAPAPDHVALCADCQEILERLEEEREALRRPAARDPR